MSQLDGVLDLMNQIALDASVKSKPLIVQEEDEAEIEAKTRANNATLFVYPEISYAEDPTTPSWQLPILYKEDTNGQMRVWAIQFDGSGLIVKHGHAFGAIQSVDKEVKTNKSGRSFNEQALLIARSLYKEKYDDNYRPSVNGAIENTTKNPALAEKWEKGMPLRYPVAGQPKYDGMRALASNSPDTGDIILRTRNNLILKYFMEVKMWLRAFIRYLPEGTEIDGELYAHGHDFEFLSSVLRTTNFEHESAHIISYYIFDLNTPEKLTYEQRYTILMNAFVQLEKEYKSQTKLIFVPTVNIWNEEEVIQYHDHWVSEGYEGAMIRKLANIIPEMTEKQKQKAIRESLYRAGRTKNILKVKTFIDEEGLIVSAKDGEGKETGCIIWGVVDIRGNVIPMHPKGDLETRKRLFAEYKTRPSNFHLKEYTFKYFELSGHNVPRFPVGLRFRDYEGEDREEYEKRWSTIIAICKTKGVIGDRWLLERTGGYNIFT